MFSPVTGHPACIFNQSNTKKALKVPETQKSHVKVKRREVKKNMRHYLSYLYITDISVSDQRSQPRLQMATIQV